jgi:hypothetical protein
MVCYLAESDKTFFDKSEIKELSSSSTERILVDNFLKIKL